MQQGRLPHSRHQMQQGRPAPTVGTRCSRAGLPHSRHQMQQVWPAPEPDQMWSKGFSPCSEPQAASGRVLSYEVDRSTYGHAWSNPPGRRAAPRAQARLAQGEGAGIPRYVDLKRLMGELRLNTVCEERTVRTSASAGTTHGDVHDPRRRLHAARAVLRRRARPAAGLDTASRPRWRTAVERMALRYVVVTSVESRRPPRRRRVGLRGDDSPGSGRGVPRAGSRVAHSRTSRARKTRCGPPRRRVRHPEPQHRDRPAPVRTARPGGRTPGRWSCSTAPGATARIPDEVGIQWSAWRGGRGRRDADRPSGGRLRHPDDRANTSGRPRRTAGRPVLSPRRVEDAEGDGVEPGLRSRRSGPLVHPPITRTSRPTRFTTGSGDMAKEDVTARAASIPEAFRIDLLRKMLLGRGSRAVRRDVRDAEEDRRPSATWRSGRRPSRSRRCPRSARTTTSSARTATT